MPYKANAERRHHILKQRRQVRNWAEYDASLHQRGSLTVWFSDEAVEHWGAEARTPPGGQRQYSDLAITTTLHIGVDAASGRVVTALLTPQDVDDGSKVGPLLDQVTEPVAAVIADGAYDRQHVYDAVEDRYPEAAVVPPRATAVLSATAEPERLFVDVRH
jgi:hypothetical protein